MIEDNRYYWSHLKTRNVTVRVNATAPEQGMVFRVNNIIDIGNGRQTVVLDHVDHPETTYRRPKSKGISIPLKMGGLDFVYTSRQNPCIQNVRQLLSSLHKGARIEKIVPDVISPGDIMVFRPEGHGMKISIVDTLRIVKEKTYIRNRVEHAV